MKLVLPANKKWHRGWIPGVHRGQDFGWGSGDEIMSAGSGIVTFTGYLGEWGNRIVVEHAPGIETTYNHIDNNKTFVKKGMFVGARDLIARMGNTGKSDAKHLHFELYIDGVRVDPAPYYEKDIPGTETNNPASNNDVVEFPIIELDKDGKMKMEYALLVLDAPGTPDHNNMVIVNLKDHTLIQLGNDDKNSAVRAYYAENHKYRFISAGEWEMKFKNFTYITSA